MSLLVLGCLESDVAAWGAAAVGVIAALGAAIAAARKPLYPHRRASDVHAPVDYDWAVGGGVLDPGRPRRVCDGVSCSPPPDGCGCTEGPDQSVRP